MDINDFNETDSSSFGFHDSADDTPSEPYSVPGTPETPAAESGSVYTAPSYSTPSSDPLPAEPAPSYGFTEPGVSEPGSSPVREYAAGGSAYASSQSTASQSGSGSKKSARRGMSTGGIVALCLVCAILASIASAGVTYAAVRKGGVAENVIPTAVPVIANVSYDGASNETAAAVYELAKQQVVGINTTLTYQSGFFGQTATAEVSGSGFIITSDGYIVTNYHVIEEAYKGGYPVTVIMYDESTYEAEIVGFDSSNDIALLKIDAEGLNAAQMGDSGDLVVGQTVYTVGNPLGELSYTMTSGIVSALDRTISTDTTDAVTVFQIDAAVNSGNSGGPVYNEAGQVIGVVNAKANDTGVEGLGFAIPISDVTHIVNQLLENGYVADRAYMGVTISTVTEEAAASYNMVVGVYINSVNEGSAAEQAGIQEGDIITKVNDKTVETSSELRAAVKSFYAGDEADITVWRSGEEITLHIVFEESPEPEPTPEVSQSQNSGSGSSDPSQYSYSYGQGDMEDFFRQFFGNFGY